MRHDTMTVERFKAMLEAYGGDDKRWPAGEREAALALVANSTEPRRLLAEARALDRLLDRAATSATSRALEERILASMRHGATLRGGLKHRWLSVGAIAASLMLGLATGALLPSLVGARTPELRDPALVAFSDLESDLWDDLDEGI